MKSVSIEMAKRTYELRYNHNVVAKIEETARMGIGELFGKGMAVSAIRYLVWGGLLHAFPKASLEQAGNLLSRHVDDGGSLDDVALAVVQGLEECGILKTQKAQTPEEDDPLRELESPLEAREIGPGVSPRAGNSPAPAGIPS